jgi:hypothetical protein
VNGYVCLPRQGPEGFKPGELLYAQLTFDGSSTVDLKRLIFKFGDSGAFDVVTEADLTVFLQKLRDSQASPNHQLKAQRTGAVPGSGPDDPEPEGPLSLYTRKPCYVVIRLDPGFDWQFRSGGPAITAKFDCGDDNFGLRHVAPAKKEKADPADLKYLSDHAPGDGCRLIVFRVVRRGVFEHQKFNLHLELAQEATDAHPLEITLDPDVPDNGGGFPFLDV